MSLHCALVGSETSLCAPLELLGRQAKFPDYRAVLILKVALHISLCSWLGLSSLERCPSYVKLQKGHVKHPYYETRSIAGSFVQCRVCHSVLMCLGVMCNAIPCVCLHYLNTTSIYGVSMGIGGGCTLGAMLCVSHVAIYHIRFNFCGATLLRFFTLRKLTQGFISPA